MSVTQEVWDQRLKQVALLYKDHTNKEVADMIGIDEKTVVAYAKRLGLSKKKRHPRAQGVSRRELRRRRLFVADHPELPNEELAQQLDMSVAQISDLKKRIAVRKSRREGVPFIRGKKGRNGIIRYYSYIWLNGRETYAHLIYWKKLYGPIPEGYNLRCKGDTRNPDPSNWELVSKATHVTLNAASGVQKTATANKENWKVIRRIKMKFPDKSGHEFYDRFKGTHTCCANCNRPLYRSAWVVRQNKTGRFYCNHACHNTYMKGKPKEEYATQN